MRSLRTLAAWRTPRPPHRDPPVRLALSGRRAPLSPVEREAVAILETEIELPFGVLVARVAEHVYREALRDGGWAADLGIFGARLFHAEVARELRAIDGLLHH